MPAYSFQHRFVEPMLAGRKDSTIRAERVRPHAFPGQPIANYIGMRTKHCELILRSVCTAQLPVRLLWWPIVEVEVDGEKLPPSGLDPFAWRDGFADFDEMEAFWAEVHPGINQFRGVLIRWHAPSPDAPAAMGATIAEPEK